MSSLQLDSGDSLDRQFKKTVILGGPLKGARYTDIGLEDLRKASKSYKADPRFNQYAKRKMSERAFSLNNAKEDQATSEPNPCSQRCRKFFLGIWQLLIAKARLKLGLTLLVFFVMFILFSRPLFYVVIAKSLALGVKVFLRRSVGLLVVLLDAILDEAVNSLDPGLIAAPLQGQPPVQQVPQYEMQPVNYLTTLLIHGICVLLGTLLGQRLPRAPLAARTPTSLRIARPP